MDPIIAQVEDILQEANQEGADIDELLFQLKKIMYTNNLNLVDDVDLTCVSQVSLRGKIWKAALGAACDFEEYQSLIGRAVSAKSSNTTVADSIIQIDKDITRTFKGSQFVTVDQLSKLKRVLTAYHVEYPEEPYIQGMNSVAAPLLCIMPEVDAYYCYKLLIRDHMPTYFCRASGNNAGMEGANLGVAIVIMTLERQDPQLFEHLVQNSAGMQKFTQVSHMVFSFGGSTPGIEGLLQLWDALISLGFYVNPIICALRIIQQRELLLKASNPFNEFGIKGIFGAKGNLDTSVPKILEKLITVLRNLMVDRDFFSLVEDHPTDFTVRKLLKKHPQACQYLDNVTKQQQ